MKERGESMEVETREEMEKRKIVKCYAGILNVNIVTKNCTHLFDVLN